MALGAGERLAIGFWCQGGGNGVGPVGGMEGSGIQMFLGMSLVG